MSGRRYKNIEIQKFVAAEKYMRLKIVQITFSFLNIAPRLRNLGGIWSECADTETRYEVKLVYHKYKHSLYHIWPTFCSVKYYVVNH